jgi:diguanylate cyclase (GGDEF)-like protein
LARTDSLTGLANRRTLEEALAREGARADRLGEGMALIFLDLDRFKHFNDCCGHLAGDNLLIAAGAVLRQQLRPYDLAARFGGDEFVVLLPEASRQAAAAVAERIRADISALRVSGCLDFVSASIGVAAWTSGDGTESLIARADRALYAAKRYGGNRIEFAAALPISETTQEVSS